MSRNIVNDVTSSICRAIKSCNDYKIYTDTVKQGHLDGTISILARNALITQKLGNRIDLDVDYVIRYYSRTNQPYAECMGVYMDIVVAIKNIEFDGKINHCYAFNSTIVDGVLNITVSYKVPYLIKGDDIDDMQGIEVKTDVES